MKKVVLYCGDRNWSDPVPISLSFEKEKPDTIIEGEARGADRMCAEEARERGVRVFRYPAEWDRYGRGAGSIRNEQMLRNLRKMGDEGWEIKVVAFHSDLSQSKGTKHMVSIAEAAGVETEVIVG